MRAFLECLFLFAVILGAYVLVALIDDGFFLPALTTADFYVLLHKGL